LLNKESVLKQFALFAFICCFDSSLPVAVCQGFLILMIQFVTDYRV